MAATELEIDQVPPQGVIAGAPGQVVPLMFRSAIRRDEQAVVETEGKREEVVEEGDGGPVEQVADVVVAGD